MFSNIPIIVNNSILWHPKIDLVILCAKCVEKFLNDVCKIKEDLLLEMQYHK